jgi:hypothetical protein
LGGSNVPPQTGFLDPIVTDQIIEAPINNIMGGSNNFLDGDPVGGFGVLNTHPDDPTINDGQDGVAWLRYFE